MKRIIYFVWMVLISPCVNAQVIEDFETIGMNIMLDGIDDYSYVTVAANPDPTGINTSPSVGMLYRDKDGVPWCGFWSLLPNPIDMTDNKYIHVKVWKPRLSEIRFKIEEGSAGTLEVPSMNPQDTTSGWEEVVFDFSSITGLYPKIVFMPDFMDPVGLVDDIIIYFDDIFLNNDSLPGSAPVQVIEDYENIEMNLMLSGPDDQSIIYPAPNPDFNGINRSQTVAMFYRDKDGPVWAGFWSVLPQDIDVTTNKYLHVKVFKPRISPVKFKLEGGAAGDLEVFSMNPHDTTSVWHDMVFDFSSLTGTYPKIVFMPDFLDPVGLTDDITIYFDDIVLNNIPTPTLSRQVIFNVDMRGTTFYPGDPVSISGDFGGIYGIWNVPGFNYNNLMYDPENDSVYSTTMSLLEGSYAFKYFLGNGWDGGEWPGDPNRLVNIYSDTVINCTWGVYGFVNIPGNRMSGKVSIYGDPYTHHWIINSTMGLKTAIISSAYGQEVRRIRDLPVGETEINTAAFRSGVYFVTCYAKSGERLTLKILKAY